MTDSVITRVGPFVALAARRFATVAFQFSGYEMHLSSTLVDPLQNGADITLTTAEIASNGDFFGADTLGAY